MEDVLYFILVAFVSYFIGTINFSKIIAWNSRRKDITKIGSHNPGTMNMLRSFGFGLALATFVAEVIKVGLTCLVFKLIFPQYDQIIYFFSGLFFQKALKIVRYAHLYEGVAYPAKAAQIEIFLDCTANDSPVNGLVRAKRKSTGSTCALIFTADGRHFPQWHFEYRGMPPYPK